MKLKEREREGTCVREKPIENVVLKLIMAVAQTSTLG